MILENITHFLAAIFVRFVFCCCGSIMSMFASAGSKIFEIKNIQNSRSRCLSQMSCLMYVWIFIELGPKLQEP